MESRSERDNGSGQTEGKNGGHGSVCMCVCVLGSQVASRRGGEVAGWSRKAKPRTWPGLGAGCWVLGAVSGGALVLCERSWEGSVEKASSHG